MFNAKNIEKKDFIFHQEKYILRDPQDSLKQSNMHVIGITEGEERRKERKNIYI